MKNYVRWYEKDETLKAFMALLETLPNEIQCEISLDIIIKSSELNDRDYDKMIQNVANYNPKDYKRWYDKNPNIHLAIESLRDLSQEQREMVIQEFSDNILKYCEDGEEK